MESTLAEMAASKVYGYKAKAAMDFAQSGDPEALHNMHLLDKIESSINTTGRVPGIKPEYARSGSRWKHDHIVDDNTPYGSWATFERLSGKVRGHTRLERADATGVTLRMDCYAIPEMWLNIALTWEELDEMMAQRPTA
jgi:hypothetical protein